jgi:hypothetical protein
MAPPLHSRPRCCFAGCQGARVASSDQRRERSAWRQHAQHVDIGEFSSARAIFTPVPACLRGASSTRFSRAGMVRCCRTGRAGRDKGLGHRPGPLRRNDTPERRNLVSCRSSPGARLLGRPKTYDASYVSMDAQRFFAHQAVDSSHGLFEQDYIIV